MKKPSPLISIGIRYGALAGGLAIVLLITMYYIMNRHPLMVSPFADFRIILFGVFIFFSLREFREDCQQGTLYFWQGMMGSFVLVMVAGTIASMLLVLFCSFEPTFTPSFVKAATEHFKTFPKEEIELYGKEAYDRNLLLISSTNSKQIAGKYFAQSIMIGLFVSIILSVILRKQPKTE